jgi:hypothetical protein
MLKYIRIRVCIVIYHFISGDNDKDLIRHASCSLVVFCANDIRIDGIRCHHKAQNSIDQMDNTF